MRGVCRLEEAADGEVEIGAAIVTKFPCEELIDRCVDLWHL